MQLTPPKSRRLGATLFLMTANLLAATSAAAQSQNDSNGNSLANELPTITNAYDEPADELGTLSIDSAVLYYKENGGRVRAIEPMVSVTRTSQNGNVLSAKVTYDALTGATPNGATPWSATQTFVAPIKSDGDSEHHGSTGASGTLVRNPLTGKYERIYTAGPNLLPVDSAFRDNRVAVDLGYSFGIADATKLSLGANGSVEQDYNSFSGRFAISRDLNNKATTLSLGANLEYDQSKPFHGIPSPLSAMSGIAAAKGSDNKTVLSLVAGVTHVLTPTLLLQLNYSFGKSSGYQTDPYKLVSVLDATSGAPVRYLYESRPDARTRHSVYGAVKWALGSFVTDASARYYHDSWGIDSYTLELAEHVPIGSKAYLEPRVRYYHQTAADFFRYYLPSSQSLPVYASADSRLDSFKALTFGATAGFQLTPKIEIYANAERYQQSKAGSYGIIPTGLASQKLFAGADALSGMVGVKVKY